MDIKKTPEQMLKDAQAYFNELEFALTHEVKVGVLKHKKSKDGVDVSEYGETHEYGYEKLNIPKRSFIHEPLEVIHKNDMAKYINKMWAEVISGKRKAKQALGLIGVKAENIVKEAFDTGGFGKWDDIKQKTKKRKGSSGILIDTGGLRSSIVSVIIPLKGKK